MVVNSLNGAVEVARVFDTYKESEEFDGFIRGHIIPEGHIVVAACMDECTMQLSDKAIEWFAKMGSNEIKDLEYR